MARKGDAFYFDNFAECAGLSCDIAREMKAVLTAYHPETLDEQMRAIHAIEHRADEKKHDLLAALVKAFITPIERDDIMELSQSIDNITDAVEDIIIQLNITRPAAIRADSVGFADLLIRCCEAVKSLMEEFKDFKKSKKLQDIIIEINHLEEEGDELYITAMKTLHTTCQNPMEVIAWRGIYKTFEKVCDACEDVADIVESVTIENL